MLGRRPGFWRLQVRAQCGRGPGDVVAALQCTRDWKHKMRRAVIALLVAIPALLLGSCTSAAKSDAVGDVGKGGEVAGGSPSSIPATSTGADPAKVYAAVKNRTYPLCRVLRAANEGSRSVRIPVKAIAVSDPELMSDEVRFPEGTEKYYMRETELNRPLSAVVECPGETNALDPRYNRLTDGELIVELYAQTEQYPSFRSELERAVDSESLEGMVDRCLHSYKGHEILACDSNVSAMLAPGVKILADKALVDQNGDADLEATTGSMPLIMNFIDAWDDGTVERAASAPAPEGPKDFDAG